MRRITLTICLMLLAPMVVTSQGQTQVKPTRADHPLAFGKWVIIGDIGGGKGSERYWQKHPSKVVSSDHNYTGRDYYNMFVKMVKDAPGNRHGKIITAFAGDSVSMTVAGRKGHLWQARQMLKELAQQQHLDLDLCRLSDLMPECQIAPH